MLTKQSRFKPVFAVVCFLFFVVVLYLVTPLEVKHGIKGPFPSLCLAVANFLWFSFHSCKFL